MDKERILEDIISDNSSPLWFELGRVMAEDIRKQMFLRYHTPVEDLIKEGIREELKGRGRTQYN